MDDERLKKIKHFGEMLERIREIRLSERRSGRNCVKQLLNFANTFVLQNTTVRNWASAYSEDPLNYGA